MDRNTPFEEYLDDWVRGVISYDDLKHIAGLEGIEEEELEELCDLHKAAFNGLRDFQLMQRINVIHQSLDTNEEETSVKLSLKKTFPLRRWLSIAATLLVLAVLYYVIDSVRMSPGLLAKPFYGEYYLVNERSEVASNAHTITGSFVRKDYKRVTEQFSAMQSPGQRERFLAAFSWYKLGKFESAAGLFEQIISINKTSVVPLYGDEATYFLALSCLHLQNYDKAYTLLKDISRNKNHTYHQTVLPNNLGRLWIKKTFY